VLGLECERSRDETWQIALEQSRIVFAPQPSGEHAGLRTIELRTRDPERALQAARSLGVLADATADSPVVIIAGTRFRLN
jgi:hypothetical protein